MERPNSDQDSYDRKSKQIKSPRRSYADLYGEPLNYPVDAAAWAIGIGRSTLWEMIRKGLVQTVKIGRRRLVTKEEVHRIRLGFTETGPKS